MGKTTIYEKTHIGNLKKIEPGKNFALYRGHLSEMSPAFKQLHPATLSSKE